MIRRWLAVTVVLGFLGAAALAQDAKTVVNNVAQALGASSVNTLQYAGTGFAWAFGQSYRPDGPYPKFYARYSRQLDYEKDLSREETVRTQFENPPRGGGGQPLYRESRGVAVAGASSPWGGEAAELTPDGWVKAALAANPTLSTKTVKGKRLKVVSFTARDKYKLNGYVDDQNQLIKTETWMANPILGDTLIETDYSDYRDFNGVKFPAHIAQAQGGFPVLDITVKEVKANDPVSIPAPQAPGPVKVEAQKVADGVWYLDGNPNPNSQLIEFKDYLVLVESSVTEARALANIEEAKRLVPGKPIRYHINSHHHSDHAAGLRAYIAEGATIITQEMNKPFYEKVVLKAPRELQPDMLSKNPKPAKFIWVKDKYELSDGSRTLDIYWVPNAGHTANLLMSYLPKEKLLLITDIFNRFGVPRPNDPPPGIVTPYYAALGDRIKELHLDVEQLAPAHGNKVVPVSELNELLQGTVQAPPVKPLGE